MAKGKKRDVTVYVPVDDLEQDISGEHRQKLRLAIASLENATLLIAPQKEALEKARGEIQMVMEAYGIQSVAGHTFGIGYVSATTKFTLNRDMLRLNGVSQNTIDKSMKPSDVSASLKVVLL